jgi:3-hydroxybutyryl-CoA dehydrogenase
MKIAVLARNDLRKELESKEIAGGVEFLWATSFLELVECGFADAYMDFDFVFDQNRISRLATLLPKPVLINSVVWTIAEIRAPFIRINAWPTFLSRNLCEIAVGPKKDNDQIRSVFERLAWPVELVPDLPGMISPRIVSMIVNEAFYAFEQGVSSRKEIDLAMKLGTNYPYGPFEWADRIGLLNIYSLLKTLQKTEPRYTICKLLEDDLAPMTHNT